MRRRNCSCFELLAVTSSHFADYYYLNLVTLCSIYIPRFTKDHQLKIFGVTLRGFQSFRRVRMGPSKNLRTEFEILGFFIQSFCGYCDTIFHDIAPLKHFLFVFLRLD